MNFNGTTAVVTGACGFIGSHLAEALARAGARVRALTLYHARGSRGWLDETPAELSDHIECIAGDIRDAEQMRRLLDGCDMVFHLAALIGIPYSYDAPRSYVETNITGTLNILEAARFYGTPHVLVTSTSEVYGSALRIPIDEEHPLQGQSPYAATKIAAEKLTESYVRSFDLPAIVVRPFNTFGPRQSARAVIPTILMQLLSGADRIVLGNLETTRDFMYVADTVEGFMRLAQCDGALGQVVNIGTGREIAIGKLVETACTVLDCQAEVRGDSARIRPGASEVMRLCANAGRLHALTDWRPPARLEHGLRKTADWMRQRMEHFEPKRYYV